MADTIRDEVRIDNIHRAVLMVDEHDTEVYISISADAGGFGFSRCMEPDAAEKLVAMLQKGIAAVRDNIARGAEPKTPVAAPPVDLGPEF